MGIPEPLRNNPFRFRRRKSLHSKLYGGSRSSPIRPLYDVQQYSGTHGRVSPKDYMSGSPEQYMPHPGFMQMPQDAYQPYDESQDMSISDPRGATDEFRLAAMSNLSLGEDIEYDDGLMTEELFHQILEPLRIQPEDPLQPLFVNVDEIKQQLLAALDANEQFGIEHDLPAQGILDDIEEAQMPDEQFYSLPYDLIGYGGQINAIFSAQEILFDAMNGPSHIEQTTIGQSMEEMDLMTEAAPYSLEQIIEAESMQPSDTVPDDITDSPEYDCSITTTENPLKQQIDEVLGEYVPQELGSDPFQQSGGMMPQEMYDEQMPDEMMDPFMIPGMMDPYIIPGPWGPMLGPGPGGP